MSELSNVLLCRQFQWTQPGLESLHPAIDLQLQNKAQALVGLNGCGKSLFLSCLAGQETGLAYSGELLWQRPFYYVSQQETALNQNICSYLGLGALFDALGRVEAGSLEQADFDCIGDRWLAKTELSQWLLDLNLPTDATMPLGLLSGGQLMKLRLAKAFATRQFLLLDEVSNHLDQAARTWLQQQLKHHQAGYLLVSHDVELLSTVDCIYQLSPLGLEKYQGNYQDFLAQSQRQQQQLQLKNNKLKKQQSRQQQQQQLLIEQQRQKHQQAKRNKSQTNQAPILLGAKAQQAEQSHGRLQQQVQAQQQELSAQRQKLQRQLDYRVLPKLPLVGAVKACNGPVLYCDGLVLPYGTRAALSFQLNVQQRCLVTGGNGCGKSTLLRVCAGFIQPMQGSVQVKQQLWYLDQHLSLLDAFAGAVEAIQALTAVQQESQIRTHLSGIGLSTARLTVPTQQLCGGERVKLILLILALQPYAPYLLLDEPDNHLDFQAQAMLKSFLQTYPAGFMLVTHQDTQWQQLEFSNWLRLD
ncbi:ATP-binding cassette domain-containing protein [Rheinheimera sp.]|uniref:ATP-binding cassette domain-containing protein n=1 Tax=Rheinheimera sp. TaxID=1869214 RepID=UPI00261B7B9A|nr:ATP-binding cassette domain-containing protein [Rheinheimera sp.]MCA1928529.1 ATP-binding cassette domain-containing protein [Rheinheimera sp.]